MKRILCIILIAVMCLSFTACANSDNANKDLSPQAAQMKSICELATMQCYYHNVAKYDEKDATGVLFWKKDRQFWIEYSGIVTIGINTSLVSIEVDGENVTITIPPAQVLSCKVDDKTLNVHLLLQMTPQALKQNIKPKLSKKPKQKCRKMQVMILPC